MRQETRKIGKIGVDAARPFFHEVHVAVAEGQEVDLVDEENFGSPET